MPLFELKYVINNNSHSQSHSYRVVNKICLRLIVILPIFSGSKLSSVAMQILTVISLFGSLTGTKNYK